MSRIEILMAFLIIFLVSYLFFKYKEKVDSFEILMDTITHDLGCGISRLKELIKADEPPEIVGDYKRVTTEIPSWEVSIYDMNGNTDKHLYFFSNTITSKRDLRIGISSSCDIRTVCKGSHYIGRHHGDISYKEGKLFYIDNESINGSFNSKHERIKSMLIDSNSEVYLADMVKLSFKQITPNDYLRAISSGVKFTTIR